MKSTTLNLPGYSITEQIYAGTRTLVYRAIRETDKISVILKLMRKEYPSFGEIVQFRNQFTISKNLYTPGVVKSISLETYQNGYALVMEDFGGVSLKEYALTYQNGVLPLKEFLLVAIQITTILDEVHRARVIHKDIKPANILINSENLIQIIDFSIASLLPKETQTLKSPNTLEGTLAYLSPEQTGRMNRVIDYRSDFYSLGVTFYELLTGQLPFVCDDAMELVHCHIAKQPDLASEINCDIPVVVAEIINKLMAKNAEERYQSLLGLKHDLEQCLYLLNQSGEINSFQLATKDFSNRFIIPEKLYGREAEVETLLQAFNRIAESTIDNSKSKIEMMLVAGFSGIGKTAVVNEVHKPIVEKRGYFIKGKYDQFQRNIPFSAIVQAFRDLMQQLFSESDTNLQQWKNKILSVLGVQGQLIIDVIPELERIIGQQSEVPQLDGIAAQNRFNLLFQKFIEVFTDKEHPLVIFLDDLQWADSASLKLIQLLMTANETGYLFIIGAYRDNEVSLVHPLMRTLNDIRSKHATVNTITLAPLKKSDLNNLVVDTLICTTELAQPLTELVYQKTKGNPFFSTQFLKALYEDGLISFTPISSSLTQTLIKGGYWKCDITKVRELSLTDDVVEFMAAQLQKLPQETQEVLKLAACTGNEFDLNTLAIIYQKSTVETASTLWKALQEGFIIPISEIYKFYQITEEQELNHKLENSNLCPTYKFLHDRVQQAAYTLIPETQKQVTHLKIGQQLLSNIPQVEWVEKIFSIVNQLNLGVDLITNSNEKKQLVELNYIAAHKAKKSTAYEPATKYINVAFSLLEPKSWLDYYDLTLKLYTEATEIEFLNTNFEQANSLAEVILQQAKSLLDKVKIYELKIQMFLAQIQDAKAIETGLEMLETLGVKLEEQPPQNLDVEELLNLPIISQSEKLAALRILSRIIPATYMANPALLPKVIYTMADLSIKYGNSAPGTFGYVMYALLQCGSGDIDTGFRYGQLAQKLLDKLDAKEFQCRIIFVFNSQVRHWKEPLHQVIEPFIDALQVGIETGDLEFASYAAVQYCVYSFHSGYNLETVANRFTQYIDLMQKLKQDFTVLSLKIYLQLVLNLLGHSQNSCLLNGAAFNETEMLPGLIETNNYLLLYYCYLHKTILCYLFKEYQVAVESSVAVEKYVASATGIVSVNTYNFFQSLALLAQYPVVESTLKQQYLERVDANQEKMKLFAHHAPHNCEHQYNLVAAEKARVLGRYWEAAELYDRAIKQAKAAKFMLQEALANELAGEFYLSHDKVKIASLHLVDAYYAYARWGAKAKLEDLEKRYPQLLAPILDQESNHFKLTETIPTFDNYTITSTSNSISDTLDLNTIIKISQMLSSEIELSKLLATSLEVLIENTGAKKAALVLPKNDDWFVEAYTTTQEPPLILQSISINLFQDIAVAPINYVKNTLETLVIDDAITYDKFKADLYISEQQPKSLLIAPILNQSKLIGIIYLENNLTKGVFTKNRLQIINLLVSQTAISLENARLYQNAQQALKDLQQAQMQLIQSEKMSALGNLVAGVAHEINNPVGFIAGNIQPAYEGVQDLFNLIDLYQDKFPQPGVEIEEEIETIDLEYLRQDLPKLISSMKEGVQRIRSISQSLRTFSRADTENKIAFNIHDGIDSTILILKHRLKANENRPAIEVITNYENLPQVNCFPGQLNQVFMNLLANAIDALEESNKGRHFYDIEKQPNRITINTKLSDDKKFVNISIKDNGIGISEAIQQKIFDHLYTTKAVGQGTGLGLTIARQIIVEKHGGNIELHSSFGLGTEFIISIPV